MVFLFGLTNLYDYIIFNSGRIIFLSINNINQQTPNMSTVYNFCKSCKQRISVSKEFCSDECIESFKSAIEIHCKHCNKYIETRSPIYKIKRKFKEFCSLSCFNEYQRIINQLQLTCVNCGALFVEQRSSKRKKTCSVECEKLWAKTKIRNDARMSTLKKNNMNLYGVEYTFQRPGILDKAKLTKLDRYGTLDFSDKIKKTKLDRYGTFNFSDKAQKTKLDRYGTFDFSEKGNKTKLDRYGTLDFSNKSRLTTMQRYGTLDFTDKAKKTKLEKYGNISQHLLKQSYERLKTKYENVASFNFTNIEYRGAIGYRLYSFVCKKCNNTFDGYITNGLTPKCPACHPKTISKPQNEISDFIKSIYTGEISTNDRTILSPKELDIYIPSKHIAIELNGVYWHGELSGKDKNYHINKIIECNKHNIELVHITDYEWNHKQNIIKSILQNKLASELNTKIYARKCEIKELNALESNEFLVENHLQGIAASSIRIGLIYNNDIVQMLTLSKYGYSKKYEYKITRTAIRCNYTVVGGFEKMWNYFITKYNSISVVAHSDRRFFSGNSYNAIGFKFDKYTAPSYMYFEYPYILENKHKFQKHKLKNLLETFNPMLTEWENMKLNGYDRIWDCGYSKWTWNK